MNGSREIYDMTEGDLAGQLVGKRITGINSEDSTITLDDGTVLTIEDAADCCAYFNGSVLPIDLDDNVITAVVREELGEPQVWGDFGDESWRLNILTVDKRVAAVEISGNASNGYYCHSVVLRVTK